jgi:DNA-binding CsgD family transcriptional regulator
MKKPPPAVPPHLDVDFMNLGGAEYAVLHFPLAPTPSVAGLTEAERDVAESLLAGRSNAEIARLRGTSVRTVANQVASLLRKAGVSSRAEFVARWGTSG